MSESEAVNELVEFMNGFLHNGKDPYQIRGLVNGVEKSIAEVIEEWKTSRGMYRFHVSLGDDPTPQGVYDGLVAVEEEQTGWSKFSEVDRLKAHIAFLETKLAKVAKLGVSHVNDFLDMSAGEQLLRRECFRLGDMYSVVDLKWETDYMKARAKGLNDLQAKAIAGITITNASV